MPGVFDLLRFGCLDRGAGELLHVSLVLSGNYFTFLPTPFSSNFHVTPSIIFVVFFTALRSLPKK